MQTSIDLRTIVPGLPDLVPGAPRHDWREGLPGPVAASPLVEPLESFRERTAMPARLNARAVGLAPVTAAIPVSRSHRQWQSAFTVSQGSRGTCWAFAGVAALEAAYARAGIRVKLSEQYLFHLGKAHEAQREQWPYTSLWGFMGASDIVHHLSYWALPTAEHVPYIDQPGLVAIADAIPNAGGVGTLGGLKGTLEQSDWFEYDLRTIPLMGRWFAQYRVKSYGTVDSSVAAIKGVLNQGYDVVVNVFDMINNGGHVLLIYGYDDNTGTFEIKNSQSLPGVATMRYTGDPQFTLTAGTAYFITAVEPVATQWAAMWMGRWEMDHDGWRGRLVIRRFSDVLGPDTEIGPGRTVSLGTWYGEDGAVRPVDGHFVDGGRGMHCTVGGQPFELYLHARDPYRAAGRCLWNGTWFGVVLSRGTATGAGGGFDRAETIGPWDTVHDGWRGRMQIGVEPSYVEAATGLTRACRIDPGTVSHEVVQHVDFGPDNQDQRFQLLVHTREDGLLGGITRWGGRDWPVEGRMSPALYVVDPDGTLRWYRHTGRPKHTGQWAPPRDVGVGWATFSRLFGGGDGVVYGVRPDGTLQWYHHDGRNQGTTEWRGPVQVGTGWGQFTRVFAGEGGVIYAVTTDGRLLWYRHLGRRDGSHRWQGPVQVGTGWGTFTLLAAGPDGTIYGVQPDGTLLWYRHFGFDQGYPIWHGPLRIGTGWDPFDGLWLAGNGYVYARGGMPTRINPTPTPYKPGELWMWRHHGFLVGDTRWSTPTRVGTVWGPPSVHDVVCT